MRHVQLYRSRDFASGSSVPVMLLSTNLEEGDACRAVGAGAVTVREVAAVQGQRMLACMH
jgi:hypothetical protein